MPTIQVRDIPEELYRALSEEAKREHRSLTKQVIVTLERGITSLQQHQERRRQLIEKVRERPIRLTMDPVALIREDRDR